MKHRMEELELLELLGLSRIHFRNSGNKSEKKLCNTDLTR